MEWNGRFQLLDYTYDINLLGRNTTKENTVTLLYASKELGLDEMLRKLRINSCLIIRMQDRIMICIRMYKKSCKNMGNFNILEQ